MLEFRFRASSIGAMNEKSWDELTIFWSISPKLGGNEKKVGTKIHVHV